MGRCRIKRTTQEIREETEDFVEKLWYLRHQELRHKVEVLCEEVHIGAWDGALKNAKRIEKKFGEENLDLDAFERGMLCGKISALRWILGFKWDMLDS